jgi:5-oxoprolinase (ATP-hydrolysing)
MGLADVRVLREKAVEAKLCEEVLPQLKQVLTELEAEAKKELNRSRSRVSRGRGGG